MQMRAVTHRFRPRLGGEAGAQAEPPRRFADHLARDDGAIARHRVDRRPARNLVLQDAIFRLDGLRYDLGRQQRLGDVAQELGIDAHLLQRERHAPVARAAAEQEFMLEGADELQAGLRLQRRQRLLHEPARAAIPHGAVGHHRIAQEEMERYAVGPDIDLGLGVGDRGLAHFQHRPPGVGRDVLERRQRLSGHGPAQAVFHPAPHFDRRNAAHAGQSDQIVPRQVGDIAVSHAPSSFGLNDVAGAR